MFEMFIYSMLFSVAAQLLLAPKPEIQNAKPSDLNDFKFPTASDREIPVFWGQIRHKGLNTLWYGDFEAKPIKKKVKTGLFSSEKQTIGHKYHAGMQLAVGFGSADTVLTEIWFGDELAWSGQASGGDRIYIDKPDLYGGDELGGNGGVHGWATFYAGSVSQVADPYLVEQIGADNVSGYHELCYLVLEDFNLGNSSSIKPISIVTTRYPKAFGYHFQKFEVVEGDANPAFIALEVLRNSTWGLSLPDSQINIQSFEDAAEILHGEGMGMSMLIDSKRSWKEVLKEIEKHTQGMIRENQKTGKIEYKLIRDDYVVEELPVIDASVFESVSNFDRGSIATKHTQYVVKYTDRDSNYDQRTVAAQNLGLFNEKQDFSTVTGEFAGFTRVELAQRVAEREVINLSVNLARVHLTCNRKAYDLNVGDAVLLEMPEYNFPATVMRVTDIDLGTLTKGKIKLSLIQDAFGYTGSIYNGDQKSKWIDVNLPPQDLQNVLMIEAPRAMANNTILIAADKHGRAMSYKLRYKRTGDPSYLEGPLSGFTPNGVPTAALSATATTFEIQGDGFQDLESATTYERREGANLAYIDTGDPATSEFISYGYGNSYNESTKTITLNQVWRGCLGTLPTAHSTAARIWFLNIDVSAITGMEAGKSADAKLLTKTYSDQLPEASATVHSLIYTDKYNTRPFVPADLRISGKRDGETISSSDPRVQFFRRDHTDPTVVPDNLYADYENPDVSYRIEVYDVDNNNLVTYTTTANDWTWTGETSLHPTGGRYSQLRFEVRARLPGGAYSERTAVVTVYR